MKAKRLSVGSNMKPAKAKLKGGKEAALSQDIAESYLYKIQEQEDTITELKQTIMLMETKMKKYEEMIGIKDDQINEMRMAMEQAGLL